MKLLLLILIIFISASCSTIQNRSISSENLPQLIKVKLSDTDVILVFKNENFSNYYLKKAFVGPKDNFFGDNVKTYGGYLFVDTKDNFVWEGTQAKAVAKSRGTLKKSDSADYSYVLYKTVNINYIKAKKYICIGEKPTDDCT